MIYNLVICINLHAYIFMFLSFLFVFFFFYHVFFLFFFFFFFQAEDGIRDRTVTGVQTCALPIFQPVTQGLADSFGLPQPEGALVSSVEKGGPAEHAGIESGDVILKLNGDRKSVV